MSAAARRVEVEVDRVDPRVRRSRQAVLGATADLLAEVGLSQVTIEAVAHRSGVAMTTIYRHWPDLSDLVFDAVDAVAEPCARPDTGSLPGDLRAIIDGLAASLTASRVAGILPSMIDASERDASLARLQARWVRSRRASLRRALARAESRGEIGPGVDADLVAAMFAGAAFYRRLVSHEPLTPRFRAGLVEAILRSVGATVDGRDR